MTEQEAINVLERYREVPKSEVVKEAFTMAISALEKQIPKKPLDIEKDYDGDYGECPNCKNGVCDYKEYRYCKHCGQALDWSDTE